MSKERAAGFDAYNSGVKRDSSKSAEWLAGWDHAWEDDQSFKMGW